MRRYDSRVLLFTVTQVSEPWDLQDQRHSGSPGSSKTEHNLGKEEAAGASRSLVVLRAGIRTDLDVLAPVKIQARQVGSRSRIRLVDISGEPIRAGQRFPVGREAPGAQRIA